jgi:hypothetical protein
VASLEALINTDSESMEQKESEMSKAKRLFEFGALVFVVLGSAHALASMVDVFRPFLFTPVDEEVKRVMMDSTILITDRTSLWDAWLGFNISHGYGVFFFGLITFLSARHNFDYVLSFKPLLPLTIFMPLGYLIMALFFWFYLPALGCTLGLICFVLSFLLVRRQRQKNGP